MLNDIAVAIQAIYGADLTTSNWRQFTHGFHSTLESGANGGIYDSHPERPSHHVPL
jgi:hypothetical protein